MNRKTPSYRHLPRPIEPPLNVWIEHKDSCVSWTYLFGAERRFEIVVVYGHLNFPKQWVMHCYRLGIDTFPLFDATSADLAKEYAMSAVKSILTTALADLTKKPT